ncbi:hypothetical protein ACHAQH_002462 [Verticillium albo-atrum]
MFRRKWSGLPRDPVFPSNLKDLGYFVNEDDEIRNAVDPNYYFKFHLNKNMRVNGRQRFHFNDAIQDIVHARLEAEGMRKQWLPLGSIPGEPQVPIFASADICRKSRVVVVFGEPNQDLGNLALRVANGPGGINMGTMVSVVQALKKQISSPEDSESPGIILCNVGAVFWWPEEQRALTLSRMADMPLVSLAHHGRRITTANVIPGMETSEQHICYMFEAVLPALAGENARLDLIGIGLSADMLETHLDQESVWAQWGSRINAIAILGGITDSANLRCQPFKDFLATRARAYITSEEPAEVPLAGPRGNTKSSTFLNHGTAAIYSSGESYYAEMILVRARESILGWLGEVAATGYDQYRHPEVTVLDVVPESEEIGEDVWAGVDAEWNEVPIEVKPSISFGDGDQGKVQAAGEPTVDSVCDAQDHGMVNVGEELDRQVENGSKMEQN